MKHNSIRIQTLKTNIEYYTDLVDSFLEDQSVKKFFLDYTIKENKLFTHTIDIIFLQLLNSKEKKAEFDDLIKVITEMRSREYNYWSLEAKIVGIYVEDIISSYKDQAIDFLMQKSDFSI
jgi:hypothetical protein